MEGSSAAAPAAAPPPPAAAAASVDHLPAPTCVSPGKEVRKVRCAYTSEDREGGAAAPVDASTAVNAPESAKDSKEEEMESGQIAINERSDTAQPSDSASVSVASNSETDDATAAKAEDSKPGSPLGVRTPQAVRTSQGARVSGYGYTLAALVEHEGPATEQGHYVCYVKHIDSDCWFRADDKVVEPVDLQRVLAASPYILFYQRLAGGTTAQETKETKEEETEKASPGAAACKDANEEGCCNETRTEDTEKKEKAKMKADAETNNNAIQHPTFIRGCASLQQQLAVARSLSMGQWPQWQHLISHNFKSASATSRDNTGGRLFSARVYFQLIYYLLNLGRSSLSIGLLQMGVHLSIFICMDECMHVVASIFRFTFFCVCLLQVSGPMLQGFS